MTEIPGLASRLPDGYRPARIIENTADTLSAIALNEEGKSVFIKTKDDLPALAREAEILSNITHPQIPSLIRAGISEFNESPFIVTEMMPGNPYTTRWLAEYSAPKLAARICMSALEPLAHLHENGVIHRDVKTKNLVVAMSGRTALVDFELGLHQEKADFQPEGRVLGTADYLAPERAYGWRGDARTDIYSMGIVMYELLYGRLPFFGENSRQIAWSQIVDEIDLEDSGGRSVPGELVSVIEKATQKHRVDRYKSAGAMREAIAACL